MIVLLDCVCYNEDFDFEVLFDTFYCSFGQAEKNHQLFTKDFVVQRFVKSSFHCISYSWPFPLSLTRFYKKYSSCTVLCSPRKYPCFLQQSDWKLQGEVRSQRFIFIQSNIKRLTQKLESLQGRKEFIEQILFIEGGRGWILSGTIYQ